MAFSLQLCCPLPQSSCSVCRVRKRDTFSWVGISDIGKGSWNSPGKNESDSHALGLWNLNNPRRCMLLSSLCTEADGVSEKSRDLAKWQWLLSAALRSLLLSWLQSFLQRLQSLSSQGVGESGVQFWIFSSSKKHLTMSEETFGCCALRKEMLSASSGWRAGMLLSVRQCRGQCTTTKNSTCLICQQSQGWETFLQSWEKEKKKKQTHRRESMASLEHVGLETLEASWVKSETGLQTKRARRDQRKRQTLQTARHRFNKQGDSHVRLVLGGSKTSRSLHLPTRIWKVYIEALMGFGHVFYPDGLNNALLFQGCVLETALTVGTVGRIYITRTGIACGGSDCQASACGPNTCHILSISFSKRMRRVKLKRKAQQIRPGRGALTIFTGSRI